MINLFPVYSRLPVRSPLTGGSWEAPILLFSQIGASLLIDDLTRPSYPIHLRPLDYSEPVSTTSLTGHAVSQPRFFSRQPAVVLDGIGVMTAFKTACSRAPWSLDRSYPVRASLCLLAASAPTAVPQQGRCQPVRHPRFPSNPPTQSGPRAEKISGGCLPPSLHSKWSRSRVSPGSPTWPRIGLARPRNIV